MIVIANDVKTANSGTKLLIRTFLFSNGLLKLNRNKLAEQDKQHAVVYKIGLS